MNQTKTQRVVEACSNLLISMRPAIIVVATLITLVLGWEARNIQLDPGFQKFIPTQHDFMKTFAKYAFVFPGHNQILVNVRWKGDGDIYNEEFLDTLKHVSNDIYFMPHIDRPGLTSLYSSKVRYTLVTEDGFVGAPVIPETFNATPAELAEVRRNIEASGVIGRLVGNEQKDAMVIATVQENIGGKAIQVNYYELAHKLDALRAKYESKNIEINIVGFTMLVGAIVDGLLGVFVFFAISFLITAGLLYLYCRSWKLTGLALVVALLPVLWLIGLLPIIGAGIDPISILVPFLIFSIGVSHAVQMTNAWKQAVVAGASSVEASRLAFRALLVPGTLALITNGLGFICIMRIHIDIVRELGMTASLGVLLMIATNKIILPTLLSAIKLEPAALKRAQAKRKDDTELHRVWWTVSYLARRGPAMAVFFVSAGFLVWAAVDARGLKIGDVGQGVPELHYGDRYNVDNRAILQRYNIGTDVLTVIVETQGKNDACLNYSVMSAVDRFDQSMRGVYGVQSVLTVPYVAKSVIAGMNEGNPRWAGLPRSSEGLSVGGYAYDPDLGFNTEGCRAMQIRIFTKSHEGALVAHIVEEAQRFIAMDKTPGVSFLMASGNIGVIAATNEAVQDAELEMLFSLFGAISLLCLITFRSWEAVACIIIPLTVVSVFCNALMAQLGIGLKVATLPEIALGVGVGVDYGIYIYERIIHQMKYAGQDLQHAFYEAMKQRGTASLFTAVTMSVGVGTWAFSSLRFQTDMGILLSFMFLVNVFGAIFILPALAAWLLPARLTEPSKAAEKNRSRTGAVAPQA